MVNYVNDPKNKATWTASYNKFASRGSDETEEEAEQDKAAKDKDNEVFKVFSKSEYSVFGDTLEYLPKLVAHNDLTLPKSFDARLRWPLCGSVHRIYNQVGFALVGSPYLLAFGSLKLLRLKSEWKLRS